MPRRGLFITFEGIEGCGKTTQLRRAARALRARGVSVLTTREPGGTRLGRRLRHVILLGKHDVDPATELLLIFADRRQHLVEEIAPALERGVVVLCDRYTDASRAYQGAGRRLGEAAVDALHQRFVGRDPDRTYLFDCRVETALARLDGRSLDRIEREELSFHRRVRRAYLSRSKAEPRRFRVLDAARTEREVFQGLLADLLPFVESWQRR